MLPVASFMMQDSSAPPDQQTRAEYEVTRAIASHAFVLRELRTEKVEDGENSVSVVLYKQFWNRVPTTAR
jgi:hypothetical protein